MKVLGICGSPRKGGNTEILIREALDAARKSGAETELVLLRDLKIEHCDGCEMCGKDSGLSECHIKDDMQPLYKKIEEADGIILGSPNYYSNMTGMMKDFIDRTLVFYFGQRGKKLKGKRGVIIGVGGDGGKAAIDALKHFFGYGMKVVGTVDAKALHAGEVAKDKKALAAAAELGKKLASK